MNATISPSTRSAVEQETAAAAVERMMTAYGDSLLRLCCLYTGSLPSAEDALQETFLKAFRGWEHFRHDCAEKTWLTGIAINVCRSQLRQEKLRVAHWFPLPEGEQAEQLPDEGATVIYDDTVLREIHALRPKYREVILMFYYQEMTAREIAAVLGITESAVTVRLSRAREQLKAKLSDWYYD